ncbi:MAG: cytochrome c [Bacteroidetes bacterium]|nr:cytochrome c [Bacteroidota bacterium]
MKSKIISSLLAVVLLISFSYKSDAQNAGEESFKQICSACHTVGGGKLVGPDLKNTTQRHTEDWLISFIKSSQSLIKSGDKYADSIFNAYNKVVMPDQTTLDDAKIKEILTYISDKSEGKSTASAAAPTVTNAGDTSADGTKNNDSLYTTTNIILFSIIIFLMIVIVFLSRVIKKLSNQLMDFYSSDRSFY